MPTSTALKAVAVCGAAVLVSGFFASAPVQAASGRGSDLTVLSGPGAARDRLVGTGGSTAEVVPGQVLVRWKAGVSASSRALVRQSKRTRFLSTVALARTEQLAVPAGGTVAATVKALEADPRVESAQPNFRYRAQVAQDTYESLLWGLNNTGQVPEVNYPVVGLPDIDINAPEAWALPSGTGSSTVKVGIIDTGIDINHPDLAAGIWTNAAELGGIAGVDDDGNGYVDDVHGWDFLNDDNSVYDGVTCSDTSDEDFHGTHVAGTIAARRNGLGVVGVASTVTVVPMKALGCNGGDTFSVIAALEYAADEGVDVVNMSLGGAGYDQAFKDAIDASGLLVVAAAGNGGSDGVGDNNDTFGADWPSYPASFSSPNVLSVAAVDNRGRLAGFSNYGRTTVDVGGPGTSILSDYPGSSLVFLDGTSMATPHVSGVAALVRTANPSFTTAQVKARILSTVRPLDSLGGKTVTGGMVDAAAAVTGVESPKAVTALTMTRSASTLTYGQTVKITTRLSKSGVSMVGRTVRLQYYANGGWTTKCTLVTNSAGSAACVQRPSSNATYMWVYSGDPGYEPAWSSYPVIYVKPVMSAKLAPTTITKGGTTTFSGAFSPVKRSSRVQLQQLIGGRWVSIGAKYSNSAGAYSFVIRPSAKGTFAYRVYFAGDATHAWTSTTSRSVRVL